MQFLDIKTGKTCEANYLDADLSRESMAIKSL